MPTSSSFLFSPQNDNPTIFDNHRHHTQSTFSDFLRPNKPQPLNNTQNDQEQPLRMTIRSPDGALPRYLPNGFSPVVACLILLLFFLLQYVLRTSCVFYSSVFPLFRRHSSIPGYKGQPMDARGISPQELPREMNPHRPLSFVFSTGSPEEYLVQVSTCHGEWIAALPMRCL